jgi:putative redox protein
MARQDGAGGRLAGPDHARSFTIETDEPAPLGGTDKAIEPMELLLAAVGTCL